MVQTEQITKKNSILQNGALSKFLFKNWPTFDSKNPFWNIHMYPEKNFFGSDHRE